MCYLVISWCRFGEGDISVSWHALHLVLRLHSRNCGEYPGWGKRQIYLQQEILCVTIRDQQTGVKIDDWANDSIFWFTLIFSYRLVQSAEIHTSHELQLIWFLNCIHIFRWLQYSKSVILLSYAYTFIKLKIDVVAWHAFGSMDCHDKDTGI